MEGGAHVGAGVDAVEEGHDVRQDVVPREHQGPQVLAGGEQEKDRQRAGVGHRHEGHQPPEGGGVPLGGVAMYADQVQEPEHIGDHKQLVERDHIVQRGIHDVIPLRAADPLQQVKQQAVNGPVRRHPQGLPRRPSGEQPLGPRLRQRPGRGILFHWARLLFRDPPPQSLLYYSTRPVRPQ